MCFACGLVLATIPAVAQRGTRRSGGARGESTVEAAISAAELDALAGKECEFILTTGKRQTGMTLLRIVRGKEKQTVRTVVYRIGDSKATRKHRPNVLKRVVVEGKPYAVTADLGLRSFVLVDVATKRRLVDARLKANGKKLWKTLSTEEAAAVVAEQKAYLQTVGQAFPNLPLRLYETRFFLFYSDMPSDQVRLYRAELDSMNVELGKAFGVPVGENIWRGKAVFVVFVEQAAFLRFEQQFMKRDPAELRSTQGVCHQSSTGNVVVACYRGKDPNYLAQVLVHETTHGYLHRFLSSARVPSWLNEGIAEWVSAMVVTRSRVPQIRQRKAIERLQQTGLIGQQFFGSRIESWHYGVASRITDSLIKANPDAFRWWVISIKEGIDWQQGLRRAFGYSPPGLMQAYGRSIGVPQIRIQ
ncbi:MAG: hypothetical protein VX346_27240 [Planctomycetota bacterium]|nr:hypothetical protein [Planctomycetota bacterium]